MKGCTQTISKYYPNLVNDILIVMAYMYSLVQNRLLRENKMKMLSPCHLA